MTRPWWLWLAAASFFSYWAFVTFSYHYQREPFGLAFSFESDRPIVRVAPPGEPANRAGIRRADRVVAIGGLPVFDRFDVLVVEAAYPIGEVVQWSIVRGDTPMTIAMEPLNRDAITSGAYRSVAAVFLLSILLAVLLMWRGDGNLHTLLAAWLLGSIGCATMPLWAKSMAFSWATMPQPIGWLFWPAALSSLAVPAQMFALAAVFPRPVLRPRVLAIALAPTLLVTLYLIVSVVLMVYAPASAIALPLPLWMRFFGPFSYGLYFAMSAGLFMTSLRRTSDLNERRRLRTLLLGTAAGMLGLFIMGAGVAVPPSMSGPFTTVGGITFALLPLCFAYATLRQRLFDIRVIIRLGLQYALARGVVVALIPVAIALLVVDLLRHGDQPLQQILAERGWLYGIFAAAILVIYANRTRMMTAIDRRFFRERYASQQILRDVVQDVSGAGDFKTAATRVVNRVDSALHPMMVAVLTRPRWASAFGAIAALPATHAVPQLSSSSPITQVVRALGRPVSFGSTGLRDVPADQQRWLKESCVELVVPITTAASADRVTEVVAQARDEALLVLGPRRSEEPYSKEDTELLAAVGASLGLLIGRSTQLTDSETIIVTGPSPMPKIGNRYRIERPIGEGGMGMVFAAVDETLDRPVAIKVIKDQQLLGSDGLARFQREARTAASLSHPHIVTIHDYGVDDTGAPFLVMELLSGTSLRGAINEGPMPASRAFAILNGLWSAVDAAHAKSVIHRDLKPENVYLTGPAHAKILDYGIAKAITSKPTHATTGGVLGTLAYMAPEQASGGTASPAWDHWALSVIAYEMLTGRHPFGGGLPITTAVPIRTLAQHLDEALATAIDHALTLDASKRRFARIGTGTNP